MFQNRMRKQAVSSSILSECAMKCGNSQYTIWYIPDPRLGHLLGLQERHDCTNPDENTSDVVKMDAEIQWKKSTQLPNLPLLVTCLIYTIELHMQTPKF